MGCVMKKVIGIALVIMLLVTACGDNETVQTEEALKEEIRREMEAEAKLKEEVKAELEAEKIEENVMVEGVYGLEVMAGKAFENGVRFSGELICNTAPYYLVLYNELESINVAGQEYNYIALNEDIVSKYVERKNFSYHLEGFPMVESSDFTEFTIEFNPDTAKNVEGNLMVYDYRIIENPYDDGNLLIDYTNQPYPTKYYQDVLYTLCLGIYSADEDNPKENLGYSKNADFKEAVDTILAKGYELQKVEGKYGYDSFYKVINKSSYNFIEVPTFIEICNVLGIGMNEITTVDEYGYFSYSSTYEDDEISFSIYHDQKLTGNEKLDKLIIKGYDFKFLDIALSDNVASNLSMLNNNYKNYENHHAYGEEDHYIEKLYDVDGYALSICDYDWKNQASEVQDNEIVKKIKIYNVID